MVFIFCSWEAVRRCQLSVVALEQIHNASKVQPRACEFGTCIAKLQIIMPRIRMPASTTTREGPSQKTPSLEVRAPSTTSALAELRLADKYADVTPASEGEVDINCPH